jgi:hypothetical protein
MNLTIQCLLYAKKLNRRCGTWAVSPSPFSGGNTQKNEFDVVSYIGECAVTRSFKNGCFQAHLFTVKVITPPFSLGPCLRTLTNDLGCFPLVSRPLHRETDSCNYNKNTIHIHLYNVYLLICCMRIRSFLRFSSDVIAPHLLSALPHMCDLTRLYVHRFRGEPAMTPFG